MPSQEELVEEIERLDALLSRIESEREETRTHLGALRAELALLSRAEPGIRVRLPLRLPQPTPRTSAEKVALFHQLFRGRADVYPTRFTSRKTGKPGYAPACTNKFVRGVCELPRIKCGECPHPDDLGLHRAPRQDARGPGQRRRHRAAPGTHRPTRPGHG